MGEWPQITGYYLVWNNNSKEPHQLGFIILLSNIAENKEEAKNRKKGSATAESLKGQRSLFIPARWWWSRGLRSLSVSPCCWWAEQFEPSSPTATTRSTPPPPTTQRPRWNRLQPARQRTAKPQKLRRRRPRHQDRHHSIQSYLGYRPVLTIASPSNWWPVLFTRRRRICSIRSPGRWCWPTAFKLAARIAAASQSTMKRDCASCSAPTPTPSRVKIN